jgi:hypothetical protein
MPAETGPIGVGNDMESARHAASPPPVDPWPYEHLPRAVCLRVCRRYRTRPAGDTIQSRRARLAPACPSRFRCTYVPLDRAVLFVRT